MNRSNVLVALEDADVQSLAEQCLAEMREFANALSSRDLILIAVLRAERSGNFSACAVARHLTEQIADSVLGARNVRDYNAAFEQWLATDSEELGDVRSPSINFQ